MRRIDITHRGAKIQVILKTDALKTLKANLKVRAHRILDSGAYDIAVDMMRLIRVDTGASKASIYVTGAKLLKKTLTRFNYERRKRWAQTLAKRSGRRPQLEHEGGWARVDPGGEWYRVIGVATWYAWFIEHQHQAFIVPAVSHYVDKIKERWERLFKKSDELTTSYEVQDE